MILVESNITKKIKKYPLQWYGHNEQLNGIKKSVRDGGKELKNNIVIEYKRKKRDIEKYK